MDRDTANVPGSPNIADTIRAKIDAAELVVCDVSIVQGLEGDGERIRPTPNPNVLIELGYAMKSLGSMDRLILVMNTALGGIEKLPFDLRQYRPTTYALPEDAADKADVRKKLANTFERTLRIVLQRPSRHAVQLPPVELTLGYKKQPASTDKIHYYDLTVRLRNAGPKRLDDWYIEVDFPTERSFQGPIMAGLFARTIKPRCFEPKGSHLSFAKTNTFYGSPTASTTRSMPGTVMRSTPGPRRPVRLSRVSLSPPKARKDSRIFERARLI